MGAGCPLATTTARMQGAQVVDDTVSFGAILCSVLVERSALCIFPLIWGAPKTSLSQPPPTPLRGGKLTL